MFNENEKELIRANGHVILDGNAFSLNPEGDLVHAPLDKEGKIANGFFTVEFDKIDHYDKIKLWELEKVLRGIL